MQPSIAQDLGPLSGIATDDTRHDVALAFARGQQSSNHQLPTYMEFPSPFLLYVPPWFNGPHPSLGHCQGSAQGSVCSNTHALIFINTSPLLLANSPFLLGVELMTHSSRRNFPSSFLSCWEANFIQLVLPFHALNGL